MHDCIIIEEAHRDLFSLPCEPITVVHTQKREDMQKTTTTANIITITFHVNNNNNKSVREHHFVSVHRKEPKAKSWTAHEPPLVIK
jgi:hypothetical protein